MDLPQMTGAAGTIKLNGTTYPIRKPTVRDYGKLIAWIKERTPCPYKEAGKTVESLSWLKDVNESLYNKQIEEILLAAHERANKNDDSLKVDAVLQEHGYAFIVWMAIRHDAPSPVTVEQVEAWLDKEDPNNAAAIEEKILRSSFSIGDEESAKKKATA